MPQICRNFQTLAQSWANGDVQTVTIPTIIQRWANRNIQTATILTITETIQDNEAMVSDKFERLRHIHFTSAMISEMEVVGYIRQLNLGKAAGADGLTAEHYLYAIGSSVPLHISSIC